VSILRLLAATLFLLPFPLRALVPSYTNLGAPAQTFGVQEQFLVNAGVMAQDESVPNLPVPTGTIYFTVNDSPVGASFPLSAPSGAGIASAQGLVSFALPGTYSLVAHYSGDSYYAPSTSTYSYDVSIVTDPVRFGFQAAATSLTFPSGATTGNTDLVSLVYINDFHGAEQFTYDIEEDAGEPAAAIPATCSMSSQILPNGTIGYLLTITTTSPKTVTESANSVSRSLVIPAFALLACAPLGFRRRWASASVVILCAFMLSLEGCGGGSSIIESPPRTSKTASSAGHYVVHLTGIGNDDLTGEITLARPTDIAVTVQ
jgi:Bacterial Ig-like domain (group 3)